MTPEYRYPSDYQNPDWSAKEYGPDWKQNVSDDLKSIWETFTVIQKYAIANSIDDYLDRGDYDL